MTVVMTLLVRDEEDILRANLDFHLDRGVDHVIATDNLSTDATPDILAEYRAAGAVTVIRETGDDYRQSEWVTRMARLALEQFDADWVINNDADEFWMPDDAATIPEVLADVPVDRLAVRARRSNFVPIADLGDVPFYEAMTLREVASINACGRPLPPKVCHRGFRNVVVEPGNHHIAVDGRTVEACDAPWTILHFPVRSLEQYRRKIVNGGEALERNVSMPQRFGSTWRRLYEVHRTEGLETHFNDQAVTPAAAEELAASGSCVYDDRLRDALRSIAAERTGNG